MDSLPRVYRPKDLLRVRYTPAVDRLSCHLRTVLQENNDLNEAFRRLNGKGMGRKLSRISEEYRETSSCSNDSLLHKKLAARQLDGTESEWRYRGRTDSEESVPQPIPAPAGLASQKDEGFQRFYKAVVSPTHVRVTAGGRIVPNNRDSSPIAKWAKDKTAADGSFVYPVRNPVDPEQSRLPSTYGMLGSIPPNYPGLGPGMNHALAPGFQHYPFFPWQFGMPFSSNPPIPGGLGHHVPLCDPSWRRVKEGPIGEKQTEPSLPEGARTRQPPIPDQLGPNRSFYDGQWMMPPGGHFYPYVFSGAPFPLPPSAPCPVPLDPLPKVEEERPIHQADNGIEGYSMDHPFRQAPVFAPSSNPPVSSIRLSEITRRHLDILRSRLKYLEDQLSYNRHQIDERAVEGDAQTVRDYITQFERNLQAQLSIEGGHHPKPDSRSAHDAPTSTKTDGTSKSSNAADHQSAMSAPFRDKQGSQGHYSMGYKTADDKPRSRFKTGINSTKSVSAFAGWKPPGNAIVGSGQLTEKPTLPTNAAMAAPFRPNSRASNFQGYMQENSSSRGGSYMDRDAEGQPLGRTMMPGFSNTTTPYLVGYLPIGVRPDLAKHSDFMYGRPLTEDEQRARHMYWGKAPGHLQKGLPKFDGKDFFPPSPTKDRFTDDSIPSVHEMPPGSTTPARIVPMTKDPSDPFQELSLCESSGQILARNRPGNSTQSECIPRPEQESSGGLTVTTNRSMPQGRRLGRSLDELNRASEDTEPTSSGSVKEKSSSDEADEDDRELIFTGRQTITKIGKTHNDIWTNMLKKEPGSANAVFGTVSPTTVQGVLPQYASYATASLTPTIAIANKPISPRSVASKKCDQGDTKARSRTRAWMRSENCPPTEMGF